MMQSISSSVENEVSTRLTTFSNVILAKILVSEAEVERVFSRHKSIHTKMRARLCPLLVEKMLYIRYNAKNSGIAPKDLEEDVQEVDLELDSDYLGPLEVDEPM